MGQEGIWLWNHINNTWERAPAVVNTIRLTIAGPVKSAPGKLCWVACTPSAGNSLWQLSDTIAPPDTAVLECFSTAKESKGFVFNPPMFFVNGIYLQTVVAMLSITFGYI